jgi:hypothetical protein
MPDPDVPPQSQTTRAADINTLKDNPAREAYDAMDAGPYFRTTAVVGPFEANRVFRAKEMGPGAQLPRLARAGLIVPLMQDEIDNLENPQGGPMMAATAAEQPPEQQRLNPAESTGGHEVAARTPIAGTPGGDEAIRQANEDTKVVPGVAQAQAQAQAKAKGGK